MNAFSAIAGAGGGGLVLGALAGVFSGVAEPDPGPSPAIAMRASPTALPSGDGRRRVEQLGKNPSAIALADSFVEWIKDSPATAIAELRKRKDRSLDYTVIQRLAEEAPAVLIDNRDALEFAGFQKSLNGTSPYELAFRNLSRLDPEAAKVRAERLAGHARRQAYAGIAMNRAENDPGSALKWAETLPNFADRIPAMEGVARVWGKDDPDAVVGLLARLPGPYSFSSHCGAGATVVQDLIDRDPHYAFEWIAQNVPSQHRSNAITMAAIQQLKAHPHLVAEAVAGIADESVRSSAISSLDGYLTDADYPTILAGVDRLPEGELRESIRDGVVQSMAADDGLYAAEYLREIDPDGDRHEVWATVIRAISNYAPERPELWEMVARLPEESRVEETTQLIYSMASTDPAAAAERLETLAGRPEHSRAAAGLASSWYSREPEQATAWVAGLDAEARGQSAVRISGERVRREGAELTIEWLNSLALSGDSARHAAGEVFEHLAEKVSAAAAEEAFAALPEGDMRDGAAFELMRELGHSDVVIAERWANEITDESTRAKAMKNVEEMRP